MEKSTFFGSALGVLLLFSVISYSRTFIQQQDPKADKRSNQASNQQADPAPQPITPVADKKNSSSSNANVRSTGSTSTADNPARTADAVRAPAEKPAAVAITPGQTYTATAYSLHGRTASGRPVGRGVIAADPRVLPLGTRVRIEAGEFSGEYVVADTGGSVRGRRVDIWTPTPREAMRFGKRAVKLTVLELGGRKAKSPQPASSPRTPTSTQADQSTKSQK